MYLGMRSLPLWYLPAAARFRGLRGSDVLHPDCRWTLRAAYTAPRHRTPVSSVRLPIASRGLSPARVVHRGATAALQAAVHLARVADRGVGHTDLRAVADSTTES